MRDTGKTKPRKFDNRGSAMLVAIIVSAVVIAFSLSLLLVAYTLFASSASKAENARVREVAKSASLEIAQELTKPAFSTQSDFLLALNNDDSAEFKAQDYGLWFYVRYNLVLDETADITKVWPYFEDDITLGHDEESAYRYFKMTPSGGDESRYATMVDEISVCMYWLQSGTTEQDGTTLCVEVTAKRGDCAATVKCSYELSVLPFANEQQAVQGLSDGTFGFELNPKENQINLEENWVWTKVDQE